MRRVNDMKWCPHFKRGRNKSGYLLIAAACLGIPGVLYAGPAGESVATGQASFQRQGPVTTITAGNNAIINYRSFNILANETVQFIQPNAASRVLNRVSGDGPTSILGSLLANGNVYIANPAGIYFGKDSYVNVGGLVAAAGQISDQDFLQGINRFSGLQGDVLNLGKIEAGDLTLAGQHVGNQGSLISRNGLVTLLGGDEVLVGEKGSHVFVNLGQAKSGAAAAVENSGTIQAGTGRSILAAGDIYSLAVINSGRIQAKEIKLEGTGAGLVQAGGTLDASDPSPGGHGGRIEITGEQVELQSSKIDASGDSGGGAVLIGGEFQGKGALRNSSGTTVDRNSVIKADALQTGDGGTVILWSDKTTEFHGQISAQALGQAGNGGFSEISGKNHLIVDGQIRLGAGNGAPGKLLLDPGSVLIDGDTGNDAEYGGPSHFLDSWVVDQLNNSGADLEISTSKPNTGDAETLTVALNAKLVYNSARNFTLDGHSSVSIQAPINNSGNGSIYLRGGNISVNAALSAPSAEINIFAENDVTLSQNLTAQTVFTWAGMDGTGNLTVSPAVQVRADRQNYLAGDGEGGAGNAQIIFAAKNVNFFRNTVGNAPPVDFSLDQDGAISDADLPALVVFGGAPPQNYDIYSGDGSVTISSAVKVNGSNLSLGGKTVQINTPLNVVSLDAGGDQVNLNAGTVTSTGGQRYSGKVVLGMDTVLQGSRVAFDGSLDGTGKGTESLTIQGDAELGNGEGNLFVGANNALDFLRVSGVTTIEAESIVTKNEQRYRGDVTVGRATSLAGSVVEFDARLDAAQNAGVVEGVKITGHAIFGDGPGDFVGSLGILNYLTVSGDSTFNAGAIAANTVTTTHEQTYGTVQLGAPTVLKANQGGDVTFNSTIEGPQSLEVETGGNIRFNGSVNIGSLISGGAGKTLLYGQTVETSGTQIYKNDVILGNDTTLTASEVRFNGRVNGTNAATESLTIRGNVIFGDGLGDYVGDDRRLEFLDVSGNSTLNAGYTFGAGVPNSPTITTEKGQTFGGEVTLGAATTLLSTAAGDIKFGKTVNGAHDLTVNTAGITSFAGSVGNTTALTNLTTDGPGGTILGGAMVRTVGNQTYGDDVSTASGITLQGATVTFGKGLSPGGDSIPGSLTVNGNLTFSPGASLYVDLNGTAPGTGYDQITVNNGAITLNGANLTGQASYSYSTGDKVLLIQNGSGNSVNGKFTEGTSITLTGQPFAIDYADSSANNVSLTRTPQVWIWDGGSASVDSWTDALNWVSDQGHPGNGDTVHFAGNTRPTPDNNISGLSLDQILFDPGSGSFTLGDNGVTLAHGIQNNSIAQQTVKMPITLNRNQAFTAASGELAFGAAINGSFQLTLAGPKQITLGAAVGNPALSELIANAPLRINGGSVTTIGPQTYNEDVTLGAATTLASTAGGNITLGKTVNGAQNLAVNTAGTTTFGGAVGNTAALTNLTTDGPGKTVLGGTTVRTVGNQTYNDDVTTAAGITLQGASVIFGGRLSPGGDVSPASLAINGNLRFNPGASLYVTLNGTAAGSSYDQIVVNNGNISVAGANLKGQAGYPYNVGDKVTLIQNGVGNAVNGQFTEGTSITLNGQPFGIDYADGSANNVALTRTPQVWIWDGGSAADNNWDDPRNWVPDDGHPGNGDTVHFAGNTRLTPFNNLPGLGLDRILFDSGSGLFTLEGAGVSLAGGIQNNSTLRQTVNMPITLTADQTFAAASGELAFGAAALINGSYQLIFEGPNRVTLGGPVGDVSLGELIANTPVSINGASVTTTGGQSYGEALTLGGNATLTGTTLGLAAIDGGGNNLTLNNSGQATLNAAVNGVNQFNATGSGTLTVNNTVSARSVNDMEVTTLNGGNVTTTADQTYDKGVTLGRDTTLAGTTLGLGIVHGVGHSLTLVNSAQTTLDGALDDLNQFNATGSGTLLVNNTVSAGSVSDSEVTTLNGGSVKTTAGQTYGKAVTLGKDTTLSGTTLTLAAVDGGGKDLTLNNSAQATLNGTLDNVNQFNATGSGILAVNNTVSAGSVNDTEVTTLSGGSVTTTAGQTYGEAVTLRKDTTLTGTKLELASIDGGGNNLTLNNSELLDLSGERVIGVENLATGSGGTTQLSGNLTTAGTQIYGEDVILAGDTTLTASSVTFEGSVNGKTKDGQSLTINGKAVFGDGPGDFVGNEASLRSLTLSGATTFNGGSTGANTVSTAHEQTYGGDVTLGGATVLASTSGGDITFNGATSGAQSLKVNTAGATTFHENVNIASLETDIDGPVLLKANVTTTGDQAYNGRPVILEGGVILNSGGTVFFNEKQDTENTSSATIYSTTPGDITINASRFVMGQNEKFVSTGGGGITINAAESARLGDLAALGSVTVQSPDISLLQRSPAGNSDHGLDFVGTAISIGPATPKFDGDPAADRVAVFGTTDAPANVAEAPGIIKSQIDPPPPFVSKNSAAGIPFDPQAPVPFNISEALGLVQPVPDEQRPRVLMSPAFDSYERLFADIELGLLDLQQGLGAQNPEVARLIIQMRNDLDFFRERHRAWARAADLREHNPDKCWQSFDGTRRLIRSAQLVPTTVAVKIVEDRAIDFSTKRQTMEKNREKAGFPEVALRVNTVRLNEPTNGFKIQRAAPGEIALENYLAELKGETREDKILKRFRTRDYPTFGPSSPAEGSCCAGSWLFWSWDGSAQGPRELKTIEGSEQQSFSLFVPKR
jgi:filamentous hemagglutinin family protein